MMSIQNSEVRVQNREQKADTTDRAEIRKVAKEMEAIFINELIKVMRKTSENISTEEKGMGNETYMSLFDMEVSKVMARRGVGLQKAIENWLERRPHLSDNKLMEGSNNKIKEKKTSADKINRRCKKILHKI